jgi:hypothetical protein
MTRVHLRATMLGGVAIGLTAGLAVYSAISPSVVATSPTAFRVPKAPVALTRVTPPPANPAPCATGAKLVKGVCVVRVVRTVVVPAPVAAGIPVSDQPARGDSATAGNGETAGVSASAGDSATAGQRAPARTRTTPSTRTTSGAPAPRPPAQTNDHGNDDAEQADNGTGDDTSHHGDQPEGAEHGDD